ncbi:glycosyltransferase family 4 protein [Candidatus Sumerlaeota bacterium]|nr:glycosyltransferase family 4 protein [Candidatus Sumerlaeota bacterium]
MKIALDARFLSNRPSGIAEYCENLITHLAELDTHTEYIVLIQPGYSSRLNVPDNFEVVQYDAEPISLKTVLRLNHFLSRRDVMVFHSLFPLAPLFFKGKLIITVHDIQPFLNMLSLDNKAGLMHTCSSLFYQWVYPRILRRADWLIAVSEATKNYLVELFPFLREKVIVIHSGIAEEWFEEIDDVQDRRVTERLALPERYILYEGTCRPSKNLKNMLRGFYSLSRRRQDFQNIYLLLALHDDGYLKDVKQLIEETHLSEQVRIITGLRSDELKVLYKKALLLFFVTKYEGFGFPVLQAQAVGTPVLASTSAALPEVGRDAALFVDPDNPGEITNELQRLLTDQSLHTELVKRGYENVKKYSWHNTAHRVLEIYKHLT